MMREKGGCVTYNKSGYDIDLVYTFIVETFVKLTQDVQFRYPQRILG